MQCAGGVLGVQSSERQVREDVRGFRIPFKNSTKFPKEMRPEHLQDDEIFDTLFLESVTSQMALWSQTRAYQEATELKRKKAERTGNKSNTNVKSVLVKEGLDDATNIFHPQRYALRPSVVGQEKIWGSYPTHWPEVYYSVNLTDVGLENQFGQKQIAKGIISSQLLFS